MRHFNVAGSERVTVLIAVVKGNNAGEGLPKKEPGMLKK
jgi:hypothetical protein